MGLPAHTFWRAALAAATLAAATLPAAHASDFSQPWKKADRALVIDAYEYNSIDWNALASDKRIVGFINKASDGLPPPYACSGNEEAVKLCKALWKRHAVARELFHTRRTVAKALGLEWGAYHLARPGNPVDQANNFIDFAEPAPDDLLALDIEDNDPAQWMSLDDAEEFVRQVHRRIGRFPVLYTNGSTAKHIADNRFRYRLLSRLPLWYARYKPEIDMHFPKGNWQGYALWQFSAQANCDKRSCPYRPPGTPMDIDVNVAPMTAAELRAQWPFGNLIDVPVDYLASVPVPIAREDGLKGKVEITYAAVATPPTFEELMVAFGTGWTKFRAGWMQSVVASEPVDDNPYRHGMAEYAYAKQEAQISLVAEAEPAVDPIATGSIKEDAQPYWP
ncbi:glycoside hydrolase family 25 protein [Mesorhizobium sp. Root157]|uniref:glycoside hydrolase family 25 protein n=1 Tax=Mesorhizobium sp. Root157 TaxID=1736477 RepID=UPI000B17CA5A